MTPQNATGAQVPAETAPERRDAPVAQPPRPQAAVESGTKPEVPNTAPLRDLKFQVTGGEQRVEVRLSERGGEVKLTVRTPDNVLATSLRDNLPTLSARLAESGFKSEAWHPAALSANEWRNTNESAAGSASHDANPQPRGQDRDPHDGGGQRPPKSPEEPIAHKEKGKDFAWLMSSLR